MMMMMMMMMIKDLGCCAGAAHGLGVAMGGA
jgi:hypothetical protein